MAISRSRDQPPALRVGIVAGSAGGVAELGGALFVRAGHKGESLGSERGAGKARAADQPLGGSRSIGHRRAQVQRGPPAPVSVGPPFSAMKVLVRAATMPPSFAGANMRRRVRKLAA